LRDGDAEQALAAALSGRTAEPASAEGALLFARTLRALDRDQEALGELLGLAERMRGKPGTLVSPIHLEIARIYLDADYLHEGFESLKHSFQLDPRNMDTAYLLGQISIDLLDEATASRALRAVTAAKEDKVTHETKAMAFYHLARLAQWKSDKRRAITMAKSALGENPGCDVAKALLESLNG
jgi:tetratricopeptide (TPR) repeat protein